MPLGGCVMEPAASDKRGAVHPVQRLKVGVARNCRVFRSVVLGAKADRRALKFTLDVDGGAKKPLGVTVLVGPMVR